MLSISLYNYVLAFRLQSILIRMSYYQSMLSSKNKIFQSIIKSIRPDSDRGGGGDGGEFVQTMADLNAKFSRITHECQQWDTVRNGGVGGR